MCPEVYICMCPDYVLVHVYIEDSMHERIFQVQNQISIPSHMHIHTSYFTLTRAYVCNRNASSKAKTKSSAFSLQGPDAGDAWTRDGKFGTCARLALYRILIFYIYMYHVFVDIKTKSFSFFLAEGGHGVHVCRNMHTYNLIQHPCFADVV
jgi:hypothetical protein